MTTIHVRLLGGFCIQCNGKTIDGLGIHRVQELFCYLLLHRERPHPRETLAALLWGDSPTAQSKKCLRQALWQLQSALGQVTRNPMRFLLVNPQWVQFHPDLDIWLDAAEFEKAFNLVQGLPGEELDSRSVETLRHAVELYRGELLEGWYEDWCLYERERLQNICLAILDKLIAYSEVHHKYEDGLSYGTMILRYDRAHERTHRRLMRLFYMAGDRTAALRQYKRCVEALQEELDVGPSERTIALYQQIRDDHLGDPVQPTAETAESSDRSPARVTDFLDHLRQLQETLVNVHDQMLRDIQAIEHVLISHR